MYTSETQIFRRDRAKSIVPQKEKDINYNDYEQSFIVNKYIRQLNQKKERILEALNKYISLIAVQPYLIVKEKDYCLGQDLKLYIKNSIILKQQFIDQYNQNSESDALITALEYKREEIKKKYDNLIKEFEQKYQAKTIEKYLELNNESIGKICLNKTEECRKHFVKILNCQEITYLYEYSEFSTGFFRNYWVVFTQLPILEQYNIFQNFQKFLETISSDQKMQQWQNYLQGSSFSYQNQTIKINHINITGSEIHSNSVYIPKIILHKAGQLQVLGAILHFMIQSRIEYFNAEAQLQMMKSIK